MPNRPLPGVGRTNTVLWLMLGVGGALVLSWFVAKPAVEALRTVRIASAASAQDVVALQQTLGQVSALSQELATRAKELDRLTLAVPPEPALDALTVSFDAMAQASGVVLTGFQPSSVLDTDGVDVTVTLRGAYGGIHLFLERLEHNLRPLVVEELALNATSDISGASLVNATLKIHAAAAGQPAAAQPAASTGGDRA